MIKGSTFSSNRAMGAGGAVWLQSSVALPFAMTLESSTFTSNTVGAWGRVQQARHAVICLRSTATSQRARAAAAEQVLALAVPC
jgi:hypothetical protein